MWFAGLLIGGLLGSPGGAASGVFGALAGAIAGAIIGAALKSAKGDDPRGTRLADLEFKIDHIYKSLEDIHRRLVHLEKPAEPTAALAQPASFAPVQAAEPAMPPAASVVPLDRRE